MDIKIHPSVKDLQSTTKLTELWTLQFFDTRVDLIVPVQRRDWLFYTYRFHSHIKTQVSLSKFLLKHFLVRKRHQLRLTMTSCHCMIYDVTSCSLKRSGLSRGCEDNNWKTALCIRSEMQEKLCLILEKSLWIWEEVFSYFSCCNHCETIP